MKQQNKQSNKQQNQEQNIEKVEPTLPDWSIQERIKKILISNKMTLINHKPKNK